MIIWILEAESGIKLLFKSFLKTKVDEDIVSGFLTAFHHFTLEEFKQSLDSLEMAGLRWIYLLEQDYNLLFVAADTKNIGTEVLKSRLDIIRRSFVEKFKQVWIKRGETWDGNINIFAPFLKELEDYYNQWEMVEHLTPLANFFDILGIFQNLLILLRKIIDNKMYSKARNDILDRIEKEYNTFKIQDNIRNKPEVANITYTKEEWFNIMDQNLIKCDQELVVVILKSIMMLIVKTLQAVKGNMLCFKYFSEEKVYIYILNNLKFLRDLNLDIFLMELFLLQ